MSERRPSLIELNIVSAHGDVFSGQVRMVSVTAVTGELGILPHHTPLITYLKPGEVRIRTADDEEECLYVSGGFMEVQPHIVTILADTALRSEEIDEQAAKQARETAEEVMRTAVLYTDRDRAKVELLKALAQLQTLQDARKKRKR